MLHILELLAAAVRFTLSLHDALPISAAGQARRPVRAGAGHAPVVGSRVPRARRACRRGRPAGAGTGALRRRDRKSSRLDSSHVATSYAVFCLNKTRTNTL